ncbi:Predicted membrane protein [Legionella busanensis]|uniref:Predicted membrane protein n=1 Tax=Legionella busanensis TaxID=190655 RepID=A0A378JLA2_9GAMM|nr:FUSC family protein [Legionella busanensis]STX52116.1 Predicted membrane protein [Legionella busanensis]
MKSNTLSALLTAIKMTLAGIIACIFSFVIPWPYGFWAVITVAAVTRPGLTHTSLKSIARGVGTLIGAILAYLSVLIAGNNILILILCFFIIISLSSYLSLQRTFISYFGIIVGITVIIILSINNKSEPIITIITHRVLDVFAGILAILLVNALLRLFFQKKEPIKKNLTVEFVSNLELLFNWSKNKYLTKTALAIGLTSSLTFLPWLYFKYPGGYWVTICCLFIMEENLINVKEKIWLRFIAHVLAAMIGTISALLIGKHLWLTLIPVSITFFFCGYLMVINTVYGKAANTLAIAVCIMLLTDPLEGISFKIIAMRFINTVIGLGIGFVSTWFFISRNTTPPHLLEQNIKLR